MSVSNKSDENVNVSSFDAFSKGDDLELGNIGSEKHETQPPARYTEPQLVAELENKGIGRPATYSQIVTVNQDRGYVAKNGKQLYPTWKGMQVAQILEGKMKSFVDYGYTADMERHLDEIEQGSCARNSWLDETWAGKDGIKNKVLPLSKNIDWDEIGALSTIDLHNGYEVRSNRYGAWLDDPKSKPNDKGYLPSVKLDDNELKDGVPSPDTCAELLKNVKTDADPDNMTNVVLDDGPYKGWKVAVRNGRKGYFIQANRLNKKGEIDRKTRPVFKSIPEGKTYDEVTMDDLKSMFAEVSLPRWSPDGSLFLGIGKKGPYIGYKKTKTSRPVFVSMPDGMDPRTVDFDEAKQYFEEHKPAPRAKNGRSSGRRTRINSN